MTQPEQVPRQGLTKDEYRIKSADGTDLSVWRIAACGITSTNRPAVMHAHGGGFIRGKLPMESVDLDRFRLKPLGQDWLPRSGVVLLYVAYRLATEKPFPAPADDIYSALKWATEEANAVKLGIDRHNIGLMGFSAGGNLALAAALRARDDGLTPPICGLMLIYPMLDPDTKWENHTGAGLIARAWAWVWAWKDKAFLRYGWDTYLQGLENLPDEQKKYARLLQLDCTGLPHTYVDVGTADYFYKENIQLITNLEAANVKLVTTTWEGMPHGFEGERNPSQERAKMVREAQQPRLEPTTL